MRRALVRREAGLTLIELLVVMMILSILATAVALSVVNKVHLARVNSAQSDIATFESALDQYNLILGEYPTSEQGLTALWEPPSGVDPEKWRQAGPYVKKQNFLDPWGHEYVYTSPGADNRPYDLSSYGADGKAGGEGKDGDINSWELGRGNSAE
ncbi:MAG: type II secretion system major pseudopilin GspG [Armatimonadetes bacterium]|nr:type II secretion system major pseudopilin GspG [Armatimonadota bacterium]